MKTNIYIWITASILILIVFIFVLSINRSDRSEIYNKNKPEIEKLRKEYLIKYSEKIKNIHKELEKNTNILENTKNEIKKLKIKDEKLKRCLSANSRVGTVIDCDLFFNNKNNE